MQTEVPSDIVNRLDRLERQNRHLRWLLLLLPTVAIAIGAGANGDGAKGEKLVAEEFILKDKDGKERGSLRMSEGTPVLSLNDADGRSRLTLIADERGFGPRLSMFSGTKTQHTVVSLGQMKETTTLQLYREDGKSLVTAGALTAGGGYVSVNDRNGKHSDGIEAKAVK